MSKKTTAPKTSTISSHKKSNHRELVLFSQRELQKAFSIGLLSLDISLSSNDVKFLVDSKLGIPHVKTQQIAAYKAWITMRDPKRILKKINEKNS
jgi:hypothetical protein